MNKSESKYFSTSVKMDLALISLLKKKPFEYITVSELCKSAGVNRSTFYLHYETIGDLLEETTKYLIDDFLSYFPVDRDSSSFDITGCETEDLIFICDKYLTPYLTYIREHKEIFSTALLHNKIFGHDNIYKRLYEHIFNPILDRFRYNVDDRKYVMMYYLNGINAIILEWIKDDCKKGVEDISKIINICVFGMNKE